MSNYDAPSNDSTDFELQSYSASSNDATDFQFKPLLSPPTSVAITDSTTEDELTLDWDTSGTGASGYYVYRSQQGVEYSQNTTTTTETVTDVYGFEDMSPWTTYNGGQNTSRVYEGSYSYYSSANNTDKQATITPFSDGKQIDEFEYYWQETGNSFGGGVRLKNSNGDYEGSTATDNPQYDVFFSSGTGQVDGGGNYNEWVRTTWTFDWSNDNVTVDWEGLSSGNTHTETHTLYHGVDVSTIELWNYTAGFWGGGDLDMWWDNISVTYETETTTTTTETADHVTQVADVSSPPYTDTGLEDGEQFFYRVSSHD